MCPLFLYFYQMKVILVILFLLIYGTAISQSGDYYFLGFDHKKSTKYELSQPANFLSARALNRRERMDIAIDSADLPVNEAYIQSLQDLGFQHQYSLKWLNGAVFVLPAETEFNRDHLPNFVITHKLLKRSALKSSSIENKFDSETFNAEYYGNAFHQIEMVNGHKLHAFSRGEGMLIAVMDNGFLNVDKIAGFNHLFTNNKIELTYDFVDMDSTVYDKGGHGTSVLSVMGGVYSGEFVGTSPEASFVLLRTEEDGSETPLEEYNWMAGIELADSLGCDVVNTSLGYYLFPQLPEADHVYDDFDGQSLQISKMANMAVEKGMLIAASAGNERNKTWQYVIAPSEAKNVLAIGSVDAESGLSSFSSKGFENNELIKPNVCAMGTGTVLFGTNGEVGISNGTSFSSPLIAGLSACLMKLYPEKHPIIIKKWIEESGSQFTAPNYDYGYGIPDFQIIIAKHRSNEIQSDSQLVAYPNPFSNEFWVGGLEDMTQISMIDMNGRTIFSKELLQESYILINEADLIGVGVGVYFIQVKGNGVASILKLVKK